MHRRHFLIGAAAITGIATGGCATSLGAAARFTYDPEKKQRREILGNEMAYFDIGAGRPVVFLHGNPTSSYLWRNIIPYVEANYRVIAPDMIGMGDSAKPEIAYRYQDHAAHLHGLLDSLDLRDAVLVIHDWGSGLGWHYARTRSDRVSAMAFMEAMAPPFHPIPSLEALGPLKGFMQSMRADGSGEELILERNFFIEQFLRVDGVATPLSDDVMAEYRRPFPDRESRRPILQWPREIPIGKQPSDVYPIIAANSEFILSSDIPKLALYATPGAMMGKQVVDFLAARATNLETMHVGPGGHFLQEDQPDAIGEALANWLNRI